MDISKYISAPLADFGVPPMWCSPEGMDIIEDEGRYIVNEVIRVGSISKAEHIRFHLLSDTSHRDADTAYALAKGMKESLLETAGITSDLLTFDGLNQVQFAPGIFKPEGSSNEENQSATDNSKPCPRIEYTLEELSHEIEERFTNELNEDEVQKMIDLLIRRGGVENTSPFDSKVPFHYSIDDYQCPGKGIGVTLEILKQISEMAVYSRASDVFPSFLPDATDEEVYQMLNVADHIRTLQRMNNIRAAKGGLVLAKSILAAIPLRNDSETWPNKKRNHNEDTVTVTIYIGHDSDIDHVATALGLQWNVLYGGSPDHIGGVLSTLPGSGLIFSTSAANDNGSTDVSIKYIHATTLVERNNATLHQLEPVFMADMESLSVEILQGRLQATIDRYPTLRPCFKNAPILPYHITSEKVNLTSASLLLLLNAVVLLGCFYYVWSSKKGYSKCNEEEEDGRGGDSNGHEIVELT